MVRKLFLALIVLGWLGMAIFAALNFRDRAFDLMIGIFLIFAAVFGEALISPRPVRAAESLTAAGAAAYIVVGAAGLISFSYFLAPGLELLLVISGAVAFISGIAALYLMRGAAQE